MQLQLRKRTCGRRACSAQVPTPSVSRQLLGRDRDLSAPLAASDPRGPWPLAFSSVGAEGLCSISAGLGIAQVLTHPDTHLCACSGCLCSARVAAHLVSPQFYALIFLLVLTDPPKGQEKLSEIHSSPSPSLQRDFSRAPGKEKCALCKP